MIDHWSIGKFDEGFREGESLEIVRLYSPEWHSEVLYGTGQV